ncbi:MAG: hypothetical protein Q9174_003608, partial [Haloplaca sp. 1 TL-2023]
MSEGKPKVAYLGPAASYSHQAALASFDKEEYDLIPQVSIKDVFTSIQSGTFIYGIVPFENSTYGTVLFTLDLLVDREDAFPSLLVCGEVYLPVHHCLVGHSARKEQPQEVASSSIDDKRENIRGLESQPNATPSPSPRIEHDFKHISTIYSHPAAFGQCETFLSTHLKTAQQEPVSSTSAAAEKVAQEEVPGKSCAISSKLAADLYGLQVLKEGIQDSNDNETRFFILRKDSEPMDDGKTSMPTVSPRDEEKWKTLISFTLPRQPSGT